jgi:hypothetical protein
LAIVGGIVLSPRFRIHGTVDSLWLVLIAQNVDNNLVADVWLGWSGGRVTAVVGSLGCASGSASFDTCLICLNHARTCAESEELVAYVGVGIGNWVVGRVDCSSEFHGACKAGLWVGGSELVIAIASCDDNLETWVCFWLGNASYSSVERLTSGLASICCRGRVYLYSPTDALDVGE